MIVRSLLAAAVASTLFVACDASCTPTTTTAKDGSAVVARDVLRSGILSATLTADERALSGKTIDFFIEDKRLGSDTTDSRGVATLDLKERPLKLVRAAAKEEYTAAFGGDTTYCSSRGEASFDLVRV